MKSFIVIQRKSAMGDVLWIEPVIREASKRYRRVYVVTPFTDLFLNYPIKNVYFLKELPQPFKILREISKALFNSVGFIDLGGVYERSPKVNLLRAYLDFVNFKEANLSYPKLYPTSINHEIKTVVIHIDAPSLSKNFRSVNGVEWPIIREFLESRGYSVIGITDNPDTKKYYSETYFSTIENLISMIASCSLFIGLDSGPSHIAASLGIPSLIFFGAVDPKLRHIPELFNGEFLQGDCNYLGCYHDYLDNESRICRVVGASDPAPCCKFTTNGVIEAIKRVKSL